MDQKVKLVYNFNFEQGNVMPFQNKKIITAEKSDRKKEKQWRHSQIIS